MVSLESETWHESGVTLVALTVANDFERPRRVEVRNELSGPVWPPRRRGVPEAGWTDDGFAGTVPPGRHALGYASPAEPAAPPATVAAVEPADSTAPTPADVVRELGDPRPPVVEVGGDDGSSSASPRVGERPQVDGGEATAPDAETVVDAERDDAGGTDYPSDVERWLADCQRRVARAEALAAATTVPEATDAVRAVGGLDGVERLSASLENDRRKLATLEESVDGLYERAETVEIPLATLWRLA